MFLKFLLNSFVIFLIIDFSTIIKCHKLITNPYPVQEYDSIIVSSDPIRITERKQNETKEEMKNKYKKFINANKRSFNDCPKNDFKCLYGSSDENEEADEEIDGNKNYNDDGYSYSQSSSTYLNNKNENLNNDKKTNSGKAYWDGIDDSNHHYHHHHHHHHQGNDHNSYDDKNRWVTLDPVPWSTSKISKWKPNVEIHETSSPWMFNNNYYHHHHHLSTTTQRPPVQQFWVSGSNFKPQKPHTQWGIGSNDIITDNRPSSFPNDNDNNYATQPYHQNSYHEFKEPYRRRYHHGNVEESTGDYRKKYTTNSHPSTYPSQGNGEWVLLSTKKGYSHPHKTNERVLWSRNIKPIDISRYHEENLNDKKFMLIHKQMFGGSEKNKTVNNGGMIPLQIIEKDSVKNGEPTKTITKKVKLEVLPSLESTTLSYGGHVEVDTKPVYDRLQEEKVKKLQNVGNVKKNKIRKYKLVPKSMVTGKGIAQRSALTIAAVGAGMIPATMALLLPMALSRNKRSNKFHQKINHQPYPVNPQ